MDKFASLDAFVRVVEAGSFAAAARDVGQSRSQVNRLVIALEDSLGVHLLNRTTRQLAPTETGRGLYERARVLLADLREAEEAVREQRDVPSGDLRINAPMSFGTLHLGPALVAFAKRYEEIRVQLDLTDRFIDPVADGYDITVRIGEPPDTLALIDHNIVPVRRVFCAAPSFLEQHGKPSVPEDLRRTPCLHYGNLPSGNAWRIRGPEGWKSVRVNGVLCCNNAEVLCQAAVEGLGIALLPTFIAGTDLKSGRLVTVLEDYTPPHLELHLLYPPSRQLAARVRVLVDFLYERFGGLVEWDVVK